MKYTYQYLHEPFTLEVSPRGNHYQVKSGDINLSVEVIHRENIFLDLLIDGRKVRAFLTTNGQKRWVTIQGQTFVLTRAQEYRTGSALSFANNQINAPMPGVVRSVMIQVGDAVVKGQTLLVIEAMKMENKVIAPFSGVVMSLAVSAGQTVEREQVLLHLSNSAEQTTDSIEQSG